MKWILDGLRERETQPPLHNDSLRSTVQFKPLGLVCRDHLLFPSALHIIYGCGLGYTLNITFLTRNNTE